LENLIEEQVYEGIPVSPGIGIGKAWIFPERGFCYLPRKISHMLIEAELERLRRALEKTEERLSSLQTKLLQKGFTKEASFIEVHLQMLRDKSLLQQVEETIREELVSAEWALEITLKRLLQDFESIEEEYLKERGEDVKHVFEMVLRELVGYSLPCLPQEEEFVLVGHDLPPSEGVQVISYPVKGFAIDAGSSTSHTAIVLKSLGIPAVMALKDLSYRLKGGEILIVDGNRGRVIVNPRPSTLKTYQKKRTFYLWFSQELLKYASLPSESLDGYPLPLRANIEFSHEVALIRQYGAEGIGLYRTEYLFLGRKELPQEEEHFKCYKQVIMEVSPHPTTIRTFDLGGEKQAPSMPILKERNPALGLKGIRLALAEKEPFKAQLRAILRASYYGKTRILLPMITSLEEVREVKALIEDLKEELSKKGIPFDPQIQIGIMIEVPSAALITDLLAQEVDFLSIGTNDLIQYTLAIDRENERVIYLYNPLHPAILRLIWTIVDQAHRKGKKVSVCGEMAADPFYSLIFLGMEIDELSMSPSAIPRIKRILRMTTQDFARKLFRELLISPEKEKALREEVQRLFPQAFLREEAL
jgi:phosphotransferase system enzyme I (PtsI)